MKHSQWNFNKLLKNMKKKLKYFEKNYKGKKILKVV